MNWGPGGSSALMEMRKFTSAMECFNKAAEYGPTLADVFLNRGQAHYFMRRYREAVSDLERALKLLPKGEPWRKQIQMILEDARRRKSP